VSERRGAWVEVDLEAARHNVGVLRDRARSAALAPVLKAEAYGHGLIAVGSAIADLVDALCVATLDEAALLRPHVARPIILLYPMPSEAVSEALALGVEPAVLSLDDLRAIRAAIRRLPPPRVPVGLQLGVDTGMGRGGLPPSAVAAVAAEVAADPGLRLAGLWSHLHSPGDPLANAEQRRRLEEATTALRGSGLAVPARHLAASGGLFADRGLALDLVRPGVAIHGLLDDDLELDAPAAAAAARLRPTLSVKARAVAFSDVPVGGTVGYGGTWRAERPSRIAVLPLGYGDGFPRGSQPGGEALVRGRRVPLVGRVSMDALTADVTDLAGVDGSDEFVLLGSQGDEHIGAGELARRRNTIAREVLTSMALRLSRVYHPVAGTERIEND
jgi:alanine racemase